MIVLDQRRLDKVLELGGPLPRLQPRRGVSNNITGEYEFFVKIKELFFVR